MDKPVYLLDSNFFIESKNTYYAFDFAPYFWTWLKGQMEEGSIFTLDAVKDEIEAGSDELSEWFGTLQKSCILCKQEPEVIQAYADILNYIEEAPYYNDAALNKWSQLNTADPWLVAAAKTQKLILVTQEKGVSNLKSIRTSNPKIPDVCREFGVETINPFEMLRRLKFHF